jgi:hypothetical protein
MNETEIKQIVEQAIAPLKTEIADLKAQLAPLVAVIPKPQEVPVPVKEAQAILSTIPEATMKALKVVKVGFDPKMVWFQLVCECGSRISVKKQANDFRIRVRDQGGKFLTQATPSFNGLNATLAALAGPTP